LVIGIDSHRENLAACAINELGGKLAEAVFPNTTIGHRSLLSWAKGLGSVRRIGIEGGGQYGRGVAKTLVRAGEDVVEVTPALTARERNRLRRPGKSDLGDALAIARVAAREVDCGLPCQRAAMPTCASYSPTGSSWFESGRLSPIGSTATS